MLYGACTASGALPTSTNGVANHCSRCCLRSSGRLPSPLLDIATIDWEQHCKAYRSSSPPHQIRCSLHQPTTHQITSRLEEAHSWRTTVRFASPSFALTWCINMLTCSASACDVSDTTQPKVEEACTAYRRYHMTCVGASQSRSSSVWIATSMACERQDSLRVPPWPWGASLGMTRSS